MKFPTAKPLFFVTALAALTVANPARAENPEPASAPEKLGLARKAARDGGADEALALLRGLESAAPELRSHILFVRGGALEKAGRHAEAAETYLKAEFHPSNPLGAKALEKAAAALEKAGRHAEADALYKKLLARKPAGRADFYLKKTAEFEARSGNRRGAAETWEAVWTKHPESAFAKEAPEKIAALGFEFSPDEAARAARADRLFELGKWKKALAEYESLPATPERKVRRAACLQMTGGKDPEKLGKALALVEDAASAEGLMRKGAVLERTAKISADGAEKRKTLRRAADAFRSVHDLFPGSESAADALLRAQRAMISAGDTGGAEKIYRLIKKSYPSRRADAAWNTGWAFYRNGKHRKAARIFSENRRSEPSFLAGQFLYWTARIFEKTGKKSEARSLLLEAASAEGFSYYSFLAAQRTGTTRVFPKPEGGGGKKADGSPGIKRARLLLEGGMEDWAAGEARIAGAEHPAEACEILAAARRFGACIKLAGNRPAPETVRLSFPKGFEAEVKKFSAENGLDEFLVYSVIREESRFDQRAVSRAGAFGLMQLIMPTAREVAARTGAGEVTRDGLFSPELNIKLGSRYLAEMLERFNGDPVIALAGYNAGPSRAARWARGTLKNLERDEFAERIPFTETGNYVRRIFRSYGAYKAVYGAAD